MDRMIRKVQKAVSSPFVKVWAILIGAITGTVALGFWMAFTHSHLNTIQVAGVLLGMVVLIIIALYAVAILVLMSILSRAIKHLVARWFQNPLDPAFWPRH